MINVIDSMCGSGKSTKMFKMMQEMYDENNNKRFLYVTPKTTGIHGATSSI